MKKFFCGFLMMLAMLLMSAPASLCSAADVWVAHWNSENIDVETDTISGDSSHAQARTKEVYNGRLVRSVMWYFNKMGSWRYRTSTMRGNHDTVVIPNGESHAILRECGNVLGFSTYVEEMWVY